MYQKINLILKKAQNFENSACRKYNSIHIRGDYIAANRLYTCCKKELEKAQTIFETLKRPQPQNNRIQHQQYIQTALQLYSKKASRQWNHIYAYVAAYVNLSGSYYNDSTYCAMAQNGIKAFLYTLTYFDIQKQFKFDTNIQKFPISVMSWLQYYLHSKEEANHVFLTNTLTSIQQEPKNIGICKMVITFCNAYIAKANSSKIKIPLGIIRVKYDAEFHCAKEHKNRKQYTLALKYYQRAKNTLSAHKRTYFNFITTYNEDITRLSKLHTEIFPHI